jgi:ElaA protein
MNKPRNILPVDKPQAGSEWAWNCLPFRELALEELYAILRLRSEVFVVEQACIFLDMDDKDPSCHHIMGRENGILGAYARILPPGLAYPEPSIGRVVSSPQVRRTGAGRLLMHHAINHTKRLYGASDIRIGAQLYLKDFYGSLGFAEQGDVYLEDGIRHVEMVLKA